MIPFNLTTDAKIAYYKMKSKILTGEKKRVIEDKLILLYTKELFKLRNEITLSSCTDYLSVKTKEKIIEKYDKARDELILKKEKNYG